MFKFIAISLALLSAPAFAQSTDPTSQMAPEVRPVGDIPDNQAFVPYRSVAGGYTVSAPEGWARSVSGMNVSFLSKLGEIRVTATPDQAAPSATMPSINTVRNDIMAKLMNREPGVKLGAIKTVMLPAGPAIQVSFDSLSAPNAVTGKAALLENDLYVLNHAGKQLQLRFSAPKGSDNVDAWNLMARSLRWK